ncbi:MAG: cytotoxic translational repressor of toxin-antitoxin stability system [Stygiobacter sp.]|nr:MAG: cytotoxic translational repressor of toxin-antitoxin stability system [Stygiobacter sp.]KAF0210215.1 MAG: cytotoxic translational repressor of toxin-antitoxin stability [Ignavibacteria bacterium]RJQ59153.1 MAG: type II toxin-antitoxin system RelE/ParE family toxin [Stygiobacter sp.]
MYKIQILKSADKTLRNVAKKERVKIVEQISQLAENPRPFGCKKLRGTEFYRIRIGDYRVIYKIEDEVLLILVIRIGHRKDIYK